MARTTEIVDVEIRGDAQRLNRAVNQAVRGIQRIGAASRREMGRIQRAAKSAASGFAGGLAGGFGGAALGSALRQDTASSVGVFSSFTENISRLNATFGDTGEAKKRTEEITRKLQSLNRSMITLTDAASTYEAILGNLLKGTGVDSKKLAVSLTGRGVDIASRFDTSDADALDRLRAMLTGSSEVVERYAVNVKQSAIDKVLAKYKNIPSEFDEAAKSLARLKILASATASAFGDARRTAGDFAGQVKILEQLREKADIKLGKAIAPYSLAFSHFITALRGTVAAGIEQVSQNVGDPSTLLPGGKAVGGDLEQLATEGLEKLNEAARETPQSLAQAAAALENLNALAQSLLGTFGQALGGYLGDANRDNWRNVLATGVGGLFEYGAARYLPTENQSQDATATNTAEGGNNK